MELGAAGYAAAGAATAGSVGMGLFGYNRGNYMMDQKLHWSRFNAGFAMACAQTDQYKEDLVDLTTLTTNRMHVYADIAGMTATILTAIFCPGRVGLHTPPPPGWFMGLMMVNVGGAYIWLGLTMWLAMHACLRANAATTHMLTRFVRLPIPGNWMLDRARKFLGSWEEQPLREVLRIPWTRHQYRDDGATFQEGSENMEINAEALRRTRHGADVPAWYRKEQSIDKGEAFESMMPLAAQGSAPEHFEVYREIQNEWWPYDVYARISIFLAFMHLLHCWTYQHMGHLFCENRAVFVVGLVCIPTCVLQNILLTLDIMPGMISFSFQRLGPLAQLVAWVALAIEYQPYYDPGTAFIGYVLVYITYAFHIIYTLQLLRICAPDFSAPDQAEVPAGTWWPGQWRLPKAFKHTIWLVAPPRHLEPGQTDLVGEMRRASEGGTPGLGQAGRLTYDAAEAKRRDVHRALGKQGESPAWFNVRTGLLGLLIAWIYLVIGFTIEIANAHTTHPSVLNAFGLPNNLRDPRYRPPKVGYHEPTEVGTGGSVHGPAVGIAHHARRLQVEGLLQEGLDMAALPRDELAAKIRRVLPFLSELSENKRFPLPMSASMIDAHAAVVEPAPTEIQWPKLFEPRLLCSHAQRILALSHHGRGALITPGSPVASPVALLGVHGPLRAAHWDAKGLLLLASSGVTFECETPAADAWSCRDTRLPALPLGGSRG
eukprot:CAMPEP_0181538630 /NCGR_PEP_ID=MMETSP1110-20121109/75966_1 /TAXON_ID=174948 /ORGANISM="Symbiodinium sp., Strain CCMP421" /LENGTH=713 /DNA_ID=CAMNT_0023670239 /DNA_START=69 /DNA_END=2207 /DNA_ORIENTATION=+